jgi:2-oxoglutarate ferredoxin oxidoreductase subunit alpha
MAKQLMKGNEAIAKAAILAGCRAYFGYPITPQNELCEYMAKYMASYGGVFVQAESEVAAINMVYGAAGSGSMAMTSSSSPGIALKQEGITYCAGAELPALIVSVSRGGPGLGGILPSQGDYNQATRGGGNGDYHVPVFAPASIQEAASLVRKGFQVAIKYRNPVMVLADGIIGQMMEPVEMNPDPIEIEPFAWAADGNSGLRPRNIVNSLHLKVEDLEAHNIHLQEKYRAIEENETMFEAYKTQDAEYLFVAYGTPSRIVKSAIEDLRSEGIKAGLLRPISLWPFPYEEIRRQSERMKFVFVAELSGGQMLLDVKLAIGFTKPIHFYGRMGGGIFEPAELVAAFKKHLEVSGK